MRLNLSVLSTYFLTICLALTIQSSSAQNKFNQTGNRIDSLGNIGLLKSALKEVDNLEILARKSNNPSQQIRAVIYRMTFQSYLEENALVAIIDRLRSDIDKASFPTKPVLQSLLAEIYWKYYQQNRYQFSGRSRLDKPDADFRKWDLQTITNETSTLYKLSLAYALKEQNTPVNVLDGVLEGDETTRYLRPTLYDLLVHRAFDFYLGEEPELTKPRLPFLLNSPALFGDSRNFVAITFKTTDTCSNFYRGLELLQQVSLFHLKQNNIEALADIDLKRMYFLYNKAKLACKDSLYLAALQQITVNYSNKAISSQVLVLQGQYYQGLDSLTIAYSYFKKAVSAYPVSLGGKNALKLIDQIEAKELSVTTENLNVPAKPLLALLNYKNVTHAKIAIYRLSASQIDIYNSYNNYPSQKQRSQFLQKLKPVATNELTWPDAGDYRKHSAEIKIDALPPGNYVLMAYSGEANDNTLTGLSEFNVSKLAYLARSNPNQNVEIRVTDRATGIPLAGVQVKINGEYYGHTKGSTTNKWMTVTETGISDKEGAYVVQQAFKQHSLSILRSRGIPSHESSKYISGARDNSDENDEPDDRTVLFTDRQIYRPGQTIYFKGVQLELYSIVKTK
jgi:hypothetical protein